MKRARCWLYHWFDWRRADGTMLVTYPLHPGDDVGGSIRVPVCGRHARRIERWNRTKHPHSPAFSDYRPYP